MPKTWDQVKEIFAQALEQGAEQRTGFVRQACGDDAALCSEVESLLAHHASADTLLENSPLANVLSFPPDAMVGRRIGPYRIVREIGQGGMAVVYLGERDDQNYRKRVALKMLKPGIGTEHLVQRFRNERQVLAALEHPNIVTLLDGGSTENGSPFLVMEYVEGLPIDQYCDRNRLSIEGRLRLFREVCSAVQYAHQHLVIHRDLKPGNILITGEGLPRLLDFGIAKLLSPDCYESPLITQTNWRPMTPGYASPEQVRGGAVTSASDIYSLGVLLYEILTGDLPYETADRSWLEIEHQICEQEPCVPSMRVGSGFAHLKSAAETRAAEPRQLAQMLHGDLDCITMKALEKDPRQRYATVSELSADIAKHLSHQPISARPSSALYRVQKYVRRHPLGLTVAAVLVFLLAGFAVTQSLQLRRITRERDRANRITAFMEGMFKVSDPSEARGNSITVREILDKASNTIDSGLAQDPELQAQMMYVMGNVYKGLGIFPQAQALFGKSADIRNRVLGPENSETLRSMDDLAWILNQEGHQAEAEKLQRETVATRRRVSGEENFETLKSMSNLAWTLDREGNYAEAERLERKVLQIRRRGNKAYDRDILSAMNNLAATLGHEGHYTEAERLKREILATRERTLGLEDPLTLTSMNNLSFTLQQEGHYAEAEKWQRKTLTLQNRILGKDHPDTLRSMNNLANTLVHEGYLAEGAQLQRETLAIKERVLGPEHQDTLWAMKELASTLEEEGHLTESEKLLRQTLEIQRRVLGPERPNTLGTMSNLADTLTKEGRYSEAENLQRQTIDMMRRVLGPEHPDTLATTDGLAHTLDRERNYVEAEMLARETLATQRRVLGAEHPAAANTAYDLGCILAHSGRNDEAFSVLREAIDHGLDIATGRAMATTPDLKSLRKDMRFAEIVADAQRHATAKQPL